MDASKTEVDAFKVFSNVDFVDWSRSAPGVLEEERISTPRPETPREQRTPRAPSRERTPPREERERTPQREERTPQREERRTPPREERVHTPRELTPRPVTPRDPPEAPTRRPIPRPRKYTAAEENEDYEVLNEKDGILQDLLQMEKNGSRLSRKWDIAIHTLDELQFEYDRLQTEQTASSHVNYMKTGLQLGMSGLEVALVKAGITSVAGWSSEACRDMTQYNRPLTRIYKKYWRTQHTGPVTELGVLIFGSLAWTVAKNNVLGVKPGVPTASSEPPRMRPPPPPGGSKGPSWNFTPPPRAPVSVEEIKEPEKAVKEVSVKVSPKRSPNTPRPKSTRSGRGRRAMETVLEL